MNPFEIRLIIAAIALAAAAAGGWTLEHWRTGAEIEHLKRERDQAIAQGQVLAGSVKACNAGVELAQRVSTAAIAQGREMLAAAKKAAAGNEATSAWLEQLLAQPDAAIGDCNAAWSTIEQKAKPRP